MTVMCCVLCGSEDHLPALSGAGFDDPRERFELVRCSGCGLVSVAPLLTADALERHYSLSYYGGSADQKFHKLAELLVNLANRMRARALLAALGTHDPRQTRVLDVGCGRATFLKYLHRRGYVCTGIDISSFPLPPSEPGLTFVSGTLDDARLDPGSMDAASIWHVLEHTPDPSQTIRGVARLLRPGGTLGIAVPNYGSVQRSLFGPHWFHLDLPRHLYHFDRAALERMLRETGLEILSVSTHSIDQNYFGFVQSALTALSPSRPNRLYAQLKRKAPRGESPASRMMQFALGAMLLPASLLESAATVPVGRGATLIVYARKRPGPAT